MRVYFAYDLHPLDFSSGKVGSKNLFIPSE